MNICHWFVVWRGISTIGIIVHLGCMTTASTLNKPLITSGSYEQDDLEAGLNSSMEVRPCSACCENSIK